MNASRFIKQIQNTSDLPKEIRLYLIDGNDHYFIKDGLVKKGFDKKITLIKNRDSVLSAFSKMAFLFDEIIRLRIVQYSDKQNSDDLLYLLNLVPLNRKIRTFLDWHVFGPEYTREMSRLFEVRNDVSHCVSLDEVIYNPNSSKFPLSTVSGFKKFSSDFQKSWNALLKTYVQEQGKIDWEKLSRFL